MIIGYAAAFAPASKYGTSRPGNESFEILYWNRFTIHERKMQLTIYQNTLQGSCWSTKVVLTKCLGPGAETRMNKTRDFRNKSWSGDESQKLTYATDHRNFRFQMQHVLAKFHFFGTILTISTRKWKKAGTICTWNVQKGDENISRPICSPSYNFLFHFLVT